MVLSRELMAVLRGAMGSGSGETLIAGWRSPRVSGSWVSGTHKGRGLDMLGAGGDICPRCPGYGLG